MSQPTFDTSTAARVAPQLNPAFRRILIATDGSSAASVVIDAGIALARALALPVVIVHSMHAWHGGALIRSILRCAEVAAEDGLLARAEACLNQGRLAALAAGVQFETRLSYDDHAVRAILDAAREADCDLILLGSDERHGWFHGNVTRRLVERAEASVLVIPVRPPAR
ncbi:MAG: universal stress protein [Luteibacter sp.]